jgi:ubiquinone biosynthesis protein UbiJ
MSELPSVVKRMIAELEEIEPRLDRATAFLQSETFKHLPPEEQLLFHDQVTHMRGYRDSLTTRLEMIKKRIG